MSTMSTVPATVATLDVPDAHLYYEVRGSGALVLLLGTPMDATSFAPLAELLATEFTVLTTDPRGIHRSTVDYPECDATVELRADDLVRLIANVDAGPAAVVGSSGGAVTALALAQHHPESVSTVVAHEPPLVELLPDRDERHAGTEEIIAKWFDGDQVGSWRAFLTNADIRMPDEVFDQIFGGEPDPLTVATTDFQNAHMLRPTTHWRPDISALRNGPCRIVVGIGEESAGQLCDRSSRALAAALGIEATMFPGDHIGFAEVPADFASRLRSVLSQGLS
jgi:pimeloyl-ACP methyl ester carboxylesterase